jgi:hypothetical protein
VKNAPNKAKQEWKTLPNSTAIGETVQKSVCTQFH